MKSMREEHREKGEGDWERLLIEMFVSFSFFRFLLFQRDVS